MATEEVGARLTLRGRPEFTRDTRVAAGDIDHIGDRARHASTSFGALGTASSALLRGGLGLVGAAARVAATGAVVLTGAAAAGGLALLRMSSDAAETASKFGTVFGGEGDEVTSWIRGIQGDVHIATQELQDAASTFGVFGQAVGVPQAALGEFSTALAQAGLDLSSFSNASPEDVFLALRSGLAGESEPLRQFGIFLSDASLNAFAAAQGINKTTAEMTEQEKVLLRQQFILANLAAAEGDLARTSEGVANQTRGFLGVLKDLGVEIGNVLTPAAEALLPVLTDGLGGAVDRLRRNLPDLQRRVGDWSDSLVSLYRTIRGGGLDAAAFDMRVEAVFGDRFGGFLGGAIDLVQSLRDNIGDLGAQEGLSTTIEGLFGEGAAGIFDRVATALGDLFTIVRDVVVPAWQGAIETLGPAAGLGLRAFGTALGWAAENADALAPVLTVIFETWIISGTISRVVAMGTAFTGLATALGLTTTAAGASGAAGAFGALKAVPILGWIITAAAAFGALYFHVEEVRTAVDGLWQDLQTVWDFFVGNDVPGAAAGSAAADILPFLPGPAGALVSSLTPDPNDLGGIAGTDLSPAAAAAAILGDTPSIPSPGSGGVFAAAPSPGSGGVYRAVAVPGEIPAPMVTDRSITINMPGVVFQGGVQDESRARTIAERVAREVLIATERG